MVVQRLICWNAHSFDDFKQMGIFDILRRRKDVACTGVLETWQDYKFSTYEGFRVSALECQRDRRGVATFYDNRFHVVEKFTLQTAHYSIISGLVGDVLVMMVYVPNGATRPGIEGFFAKFHEAHLEYSHIVVLGDLNARMGIIQGRSRNSAGNYMQRRLGEGWCTRMPLNMVTFHPAQSCLDHVLTTCTSRIIDYGIITDHLESDHYPIWVDVDVGELVSARTPAKGRISVNIGATAWQRCSKDVEENARAFDDNDTVESQIASMIRLVSDIVQKRTRPRRKRGFVRIQFDAELKSLYRKRCKTRGAARKDVVRQIRAKIRRLKRRAWREFCERGVRDQKGKTLWSMFNKSKGREYNCSVAPVSDEDAKEAANMFEAFHPISPHLMESLTARVPEYARQLEVMPFEGVLEVEVTAVLKKLPRKGSVGPDAISNFLLINAGPKLKRWLTACVNATLRTGEIPQVWKTANVKPLPKPSGGFRPISLISNLAKFVERIVCRRLTKHCKEHKVIPENQFAAHGGTTVALNNLIGYIKEQKYPTYVVFFDVKKAFDRIYVPKLIEMLDDYGVPEYLTRWIYQYITDRTGSVEGHIYPMVNGVPQGSVLGPVLFQIYVSRVFAEIEAKVYKGAYADDFGLAYSASTGFKVATVMNRALRKIDAATKEIGVELDSRKTRAMWFAPKIGGRTMKKPKEIAFFLGKTQLEYAQQYKYLGILFDRRLRFTDHVAKRLEAAKKRNKVVFRLCLLPKKYLRALWRGYVESYLIYGLPCIYDQLTDTSKRNLNRFYSTSARQLSGMIKGSPPDLCIAESGIFPLEDLIRYRQNPPLNAKGKRIPMKRPKSHLDFRYCTKARHVEITWSRWKTGYLYTEKYKHDHHFDGCSGDCRFCKNATETRAHILFYCPKVNDELRRNYVEKVAEIYALKDPNHVTVEHCNGQLLDPRSPQRCRRLAFLLTKYLDAINYHA